MSNFTDSLLRCVIVSTVTATASIFSEEVIRHHRRRKHHRYHHCFEDSVLDVIPIVVGSLAGIATDYALSYPSCPVPGPTYADNEESLTYDKFLLLMGYDNNQESRNLYDRFYLPDGTPNTYENWLTFTDTEDSPEERGWYYCEEGQEAEYISNHQEWWDNR